MANAPVVVMPRAIAADLARAVIGPDHLAEPARVKALRIVGRRVAVIARAEVMAMMEVGASRPDMMVTDNSRRGITVAAAAMEGRAGAKAAAAERRAATVETTAMNGGAATPEAATSAAAKATVAVAAMAASDFGGQSLRSVFR